jgi:tetratricopeptide (TPR) repeat protein
MLSGLIIFVLACSTKKNTFTRRTYHNLTSHYNVYWNGKESLKEAELLMQDNVKDNYSEILPVFIYGTKQEAQANNQKWDRSIQKASIAIQKHSMVFSGKENVKWIDDCYLMIGQAYFYKQEYLSARRTFNFVMREYPDNESKYDAMLWLARTYVQTGEFEKAEPLLNLISAEISTRKVSYRLLQELPQVYAHHYVQQKKYGEAAEYLYEAISYNPKRDIQTRMMFILAQIYEMNGDLFRATDMYRAVIKKNPTYDMAFQSKLNMARSFDASSGDSKEIVKILNKMLKDDKNKDYKDQIYYALAEVAMKEGDTVLAVENLRLSVMNSTKNNYQKAKSSLAVADIFFKVPNYEKAQAYYDTAMMFIPKDYPNYSTIASKTSVLSDLVSNLVVIQRQDSLQWVASLPENERTALINNLITMYMEEQQRIAEQLRIQQEIDKQENISAFNGPAGTGLPAGGDWYFYNMTTKDYGFNEFMKKWGKRKYEDLWRLSNKTIVSYLGSTAEELEADTTKSDTLIDAASNPLAREYYLKNLPFTEEDVKKSNDSITDAYFNLGSIYRDGLSDYTESAMAMTTLNTRFPDNVHELQSYYCLYKDYQNLGDVTQMELYKNLIISQYPESDYAKVLLDPQYFAKLAAEKNKEAELYEQTWQAYKDGQYFMAIARCDMAFATYGDTILLAPKFAYIKAISRGKIEVVDTLVSDLKKIIVKYPNSEVKTLSQSLLASIAQYNPKFDDGTLGLQPDQQAEKPSPYEYKPSGQHMFMIVMDSREVRLNPLKVKISDFNLKYYSLENLTINSMVLDNQHYILTVGNFNNASKAMDYYNMILPDEYVYSDLKAGTFDNFLISTENYGTFFKEKDIEVYRKFFNKNYQQ